MNDDPMKRERYSTAFLIDGLDAEQRQTVEVIADLPDDLWTLGRIYPAVAGQLHLSYAEGQRRVEQLFMPALEVLVTEVEETND